MCILKRFSFSSLNIPQPTCLKMSCDENDWLSVYVKDTVTNCSKAGDEFDIGNSYYKGICPDPKIVCGIINYAKHWPPTSGETGGGDGGDGSDGGSDGSGSGGDGSGTRGQQKWKCRRRLSLREGCVDAKTCRF